MESEEKHPEQFTQIGSRSVSQWLKPSSAQAIYRTAEPLPFVGDSLFPNLLGSLKASGAAKIGHLKNRIWANLAELAQDCVP